MDVKVIKLLSGEEIIGEVTKFEDEVLYIKHPLGLGLNHDHDEQGRVIDSRLVFVPYMPYTSAPEEIVVPVSSLLIEPLAPLDSIADDYKNTIAKIFNKIYIPEKSLIRPVS